MRIALIADLRAEHTRRWLDIFDESDHDVMVLTPYPYDVTYERITVHVLRGIFKPGNHFVKSSEATLKKPSRKRQLSQFLLKANVDKLIRPIWSRINTLDVLWQARQARTLLDQFKPDIAQAFRTQNEGYILWLSGYRPSALFLWGQDIAYFANRSRLHRWLTQRVMGQIDGLAADCQRDIRLGRAYGFDAKKPTLVLPGNGGVNLDVYAEGVSAETRSRTIIYPRGFGPYLRLDNLLEAYKRLKTDAQFSDVQLQVLMPTPLIPRVRAKVNALGLQDVAVVPFMQQHEWSAALQQALIIVSPSVSDGTPNSMLEAMACGALPVMGRIESVEEWITHGENGLLFDPEQPAAIEQALREALLNRQLCANAQRINRDIITREANVHEALPKLLAWYANLVPNIPNETAQHIAHQSH